MAGWSGLYDDVHGAAHALLGTPIPVSRKLFREVQKRGNWEITQNLEDSGGTAMVVPASRSMVLTNGSLLGGARVIAAENIVGNASDAEMHTVFDVKSSINVVADLSGNGGGAY
jgi:hypothetical protein